MVGTNTYGGLVGLVSLSIVSTSAYAKDSSGARAVASMFADESSPIACSTFHEFDAYQNVYGLLINGDRKEQRHLGNITQAKTTLERLGVPTENIAVVNTLSGVSIQGREKGEYEAQFAENQVYPSNGEGVKQAAAYLREHVQKDDLVVVYTTGHGLDGCLVLNNNCYSVDDLLTELSFMKERKVEGIFISDQCYSGSIPQKAVDAGFKVKHAFAPDVTIQETACHLFTPYVWQAIEHCIDVNNDGKTTFADSALFASAHYQIESEYRGLSYQGTEVRNLLFNNTDMIVTMANVFLAEADLPSTEKYAKRFSIDDIASLTNGFVTPEEAEQYAVRFNGADIAALVKADISPKESEHYNNRFGGKDIAALVKAKIPSSVAEEYNERFSGEDIAALHDAQIEQEKALKYDPKHKGEDIVVLVQEEITPEEAKEYDAHFSGRDIAKLIDASISAKEAGAYENRALAAFITEFVDAGISPETVLAYEERFRYELMPTVPRQKGERTERTETSEGSPLLIALVDEGISPADLREYSSRFDGRDVYFLAKNDIAPADAQKYDGRFGGLDIKILTEANITAEQAVQYDDFFNASEIAMFGREGISADVANTYAPRLNAPDIIKEIKAAREEIHRAERKKECGTVGIVLGLMAAAGYGISQFRKLRS